MYYYASIKVISSHFFYECQIRHKANMELDPVKDLLPGERFIG